MGVTRADATSPEICVVEREETLICVMAGLVRKMYVVFTSFVGVCFGDAKHCERWILRLGHALPSLLEVV